MFMFKAYSFLWLIGSLSSIVTAEASDSWIIAEQSAPKNSVSSQQYVAISNDGVKRKILPSTYQPITISPYFGRHISPDGNSWYDLRFSSGGVSVLGDRYLLYAGRKGQPVDVNKPLMQDQSIIEIGWTSDNKILLSSGVSDWDSGYQYSSFSIIDPGSGKVIEDFKKLRDLLKWGNRRERNGAVSPDGSKFVFVSSSPASSTDSSERETDHNSYLIFYNRQSLMISSVQVLGAFTGIGQPRWDSESKRFIFSAAVATANPGRNLNYDVFSSDGYSLTQLTFSPYADTLPEWSPDNQRIVWSSNRPNVSGTKKMIASLYTMNKDGSGQKLLASGINATWLSWQKALPR